MLWWRVLPDTAHLWDMPASVRDWLETGDEVLSDTAQKAALAIFLNHRTRRVRDAAWTVVAATKCINRAAEAVYVAESAADVVGDRDFQYSADYQAARAAQAARLEAMMLALDLGSTE